MAEDPPLSLLSLGDDMLAALFCAVGVPDIARVAAVHSLLAEAARREDVWAVLLRHALAAAEVEVGGELTTEGAPSAELLRQLKPPPSRLLTTLDTDPGLQQAMAMRLIQTGTPLCNGLAARFPTAPRGRHGDRCVRGDRPIPLRPHAACRVRTAGGPVVVAATSVPYFEVKIADTFQPGADYSDVCVAVGLCNSSFRLTGKMPGWDLNSCGFHGDDGHRFHGNGNNGGPFGVSRAFPPGSTVGCGVVLDWGRLIRGRGGYGSSEQLDSIIFYTLNGEMVGPAFVLPAELRRLRRDPDTDMPVADATPQPQQPLYPVVGCDGSLALEVNHGAAPFLFDPESARDMLRMPRWKAFLEPSFQLSGNSANDRKISAAFLLNVEEFHSDLDMADDDDDDDDDDDEDDDDEDDDANSDDESGDDEEVTGAEPDVEAARPRRAAVMRGGARPAKRGDADDEPTKRAAKPAKAPKVEAKPEANPEARPKKGRAPDPDTRKEGPQATPKKGHRAPEPPKPQAKPGKGRAPEPPRRPVEAAGSLAAARETRTRPGGKGPAMRKEPAAPKTRHSKPHVFQMED